MTEMQLRQQVVDIAKGWLGYSEANGKYMEIIKLYNSHRPLARGYEVRPDDEWCATKVSAVFIKAGLTDIAPAECSCTKMIELYIKLGRWVEADGYKPQIGDILMYDWQDKGKGDNVGAPDHVGIVSAVDGLTLTIIEGNKGEAVAYRDVAVNGKYIRGYCTPDYASKAKQSSGVKVQKTDYAKSFERSYAQKYIVTASGLNMRTKAATTYRGHPVPIIKVLPKGTKVTCYGYYTQNGSDVWLYVRDGSGTTGFCSKKYLKQGGRRDGNDEHGCQ